MNKQEFITQLHKELNGLSQDDIEERLTFYREIIEDKMEEGFTEEEAVSEIGTVDEIVAEAVAEIPINKTQKKRIKIKRKLSVGEIILLILGSPIWLSLGIGAFALIVSLYILLWAVIISLWAVFVSLVASSIGCVLSCVVLNVNGNNVSSLAMLSVGFICAGFSIFTFYGCKVATSGVYIFSKKMVIWIKNHLINKEDAL